MVPLGVSRPSGSVTGDVVGSGVVLGTPGSCAAAVREIAAHNTSQQARLKKNEDMVPSPEEGRELMRIMRPRKMPDQSESSLYRKGSQSPGIGLSSYGRLGR